MPRVVHPETEAVNADSFLDIVASVVSIMIIMVLMTGLKIKSTPVDVPPPSEGDQVGVALANELKDEQAIRGDMAKLETQGKQIRQETLIRKAHRDTLAVAVTALDQQIKTTNQDLNSQSQDDAAASRDISLARSKLNQLEQVRLAVEATPTPTLQIESYPTPISRPVDGHEIHFQLRAGRVAYIPLDDLIASFKTSARERVSRMRDRPELTETVGPEGGFRLRYTLESDDRTGRIRLRRWTLIPVADNLGETFDEALKERSEFRRALKENRGRVPTVTLWVYPDAFDAFRRLKKELYQMGYSVAGRPLPEGTPISGSPEGSRSASE